MKRTRSPSKEETPRFKLVFASIVFVATISFGTMLRPSVVEHLPLPDSIAKSDANGCALWFIGSSSIARWRTLDQDFPGWQAHRRGIDGARVKQIQARALRTNSLIAPAGIVFYAGENDIAWGASGARTAGAMAHLLREMGAKWPSVPIFVVSMKPSPDRWSQRAEQLQYDNIVMRFANDRGMTFVPAGTLLLRNGLPDPSLYADGIHLNARGYSVWSSDIRRGIEQSMPRERLAECSSSSALAKPEAT